MFSGQNCTRYIDDYRSGLIGQIMTVLFFANSSFDRRVGRDMNAQTQLRSRMIYPLGPHNQLESGSGL